jgi:hypothetical protein
MSYRLDQIPHLVEQGELPRWVTEKLAESFADIQETLDSSRTITIIGPKGDGSVTVVRG